MTGRRYGEESAAKEEISPDNTSSTDVYRCRLQPGDFWHWCIEILLLTVDVVPWSLILLYDLDLCALPVDAHTDLGLLTQWVFSGEATRL